MLENEDMNDITEEVVNPQETDNEVVDEDSDIGENNEDIAEPQSDEQNKIYKNMRLRAESEARKELEEERKQIDKLRLQANQALVEKNIIEEYTSSKKVEEYADSRGISDELAREMLTLQAKEIIASERKKVSENFTVMQQKKSELKTKFPQYNMIEKEVETIVSQYPNATAQDYENIFYHTVGKRALEINSTTAKAIERKVVNDMHDKARRKSVSGSSGVGELVASEVLTQKGLDMSSAFGNDPRDIAKYVKDKRRN